MSPPSRSTRLHKHGYLLLLVPPLFVLVLATVLFELAHKYTLEELVTAIEIFLPQGESHPFSLTLSEMRGRYIWLATVVLNLVVCAYGIGLFGFTVYQAHAGKRLLAIVSIGTMLMLSGLIGLFYHAETQGALFQLVYNFTFTILKQSGLYDTAYLLNIDKVMLITNILAIIVPSMAILAACSTLAPSQGANHEELSQVARQMQQLKGVLNAGSALLFSGILHMNAWLRWPASLLTDQSIQTEYSETVLAISMFWGTAFTLMLVATYGPASSYLGTQARELVEQAAREGTIENPQQWLKDHHFSVTLGEQLPRISVLLGPMLAGPIGSILMSGSHSFAQ